MEHQTLNFTMEIIFNAVTSYVDDEKPYAERHIKVL